MINILKYAGFFCGVYHRKTKITICTPWIYTVVNLPKEYTLKIQIFTFYGVLLFSHIIISEKFYTHHTSELNECFIEKYSQNIWMFRWCSHLRFLIENCCYRCKNGGTTYVIPPMVYYSTISISVIVSKSSSKQTEISKCRHVPTIYINERRTPYSRFRFRFHIICNY